MTNSKLTLSEKEKIENFPREISSDDLIKYFTLTKKDQKLIPVRNQSHNRLGFAVQLCSLRFMGFFPKSISKIPQDVLTFLAEQLNINYSELSHYGGKKNTKSTHQKAIIKYLKFKKYNSSHSKTLYKWLMERAMEHEATYYLIKLANEKLYRKKIIRPKISTIERVVSSAKKQSWKKTYNIIAPAIRGEKKFLKDLLSTNNSDLAWIKSPISKNSSNEILNSINKIEYLTKNKIHLWNFSELNPNRSKYLYLQGKKAPKPDLRRFNASKRYSILSVFLKSSLEEITDILIEQVDRNLNDKSSRAKNELDKFRKKAAKSSNNIAHWYNEIVSIITDDNVDNLSIREQIYSKVLSKEALVETMNDCLEILRPHDDKAIDFFANSYSDIRKYSPKLLSILKLKSNTPNDPILAKVKYLKKKNSENGEKCFIDAPVNEIGKEWKDYIVDEEGNISHRYYEMHTLWELRSALRSGDVWSQNSIKFADPDSYLIPKEKWQPLKKEFLSMVDIDRNFKNYLKNKRSELESLYPIVDKMLRDNNYIGEVRVEKDKLIVPKYLSEKKEEESKFSEMIGNALPKVDIASLMLEVDGWTNFSKCFEHAAGSEPRNKETVKNIYASIISIACNLGHSQMSQSSSILRSTLDWTTNWYLRDETLKSAITTIINYHHQLPLASYLGGGTLSSSDGQRFPCAVNSRNATKNPRYFAYGSGITHYSWTSDEFSQYGIKVIPASMRDATYILDGILENLTDLDIMEHTSDTAGYTELIFALFNLLGFRFCPRIRDLGSQTLYRFGGRPNEFASLAPLLNGIIKEEKILKNSEELLRVAGSLKMGWSTASLVVNKLQASAKDNRVTSALKEYGRIEKTIHILKYISDESYQRRIGKQLNKGEALHVLRKFIFFGNESKIRMPDPDNQQLQAYCLNLVTNMIITWNTVYMWKAVQALKKDGYAITDGDLSHLSPCRFEHVNILGKFYFEAMKRLRLRPLRAFK